MASSTGKWEVAGKDGKARKNTAGNKKNKTKVNEADLPKLDIKAPIPESKTQFDAFNKKEPETFVVPKQESSDNDSDGRTNARNDERSRKIEKKHKHKERQPTFEDIFAEALKKCNSSSVKNFISECKHKYANNTLVLLKDLTGFIQEKFAQMPVEKDPVLGNQSPDFPLRCVATDVQDHINDELKRCSDDDVDRFFSYCLDELLIEINKGHATYGIRMMIQCILKCYPYVTIKNRKQYLQRIVSRKDNPREALSLLWTFGQTSDHKNLEGRLTVWMSFFLSVIHSKQLSKYVIDYLEMTLSLEQPDKFTYTPVSGKRFQHIMELTYGSNYVQFPYRKQLQLLYPEIKAIVFDARPANAPLTKVFTQLFDSLNTELGQEYLQEALNCLIKCLEKDATCHNEWRNNYLVRLKESSLLLRSIVAHWDSICRSVPQKYLVQTLQEFQNVNNDELKEREKPRAGFLDCQASCKKLLDAMSNTPEHIPNSSPSRIIQIFKILLLILFIVVCFDMYKHRGYQDSKTSEVLKQYGVEKVLVNTYNRSKVYAHQVESWTEKHYPYYYKKVRDVVEPASDYTVTKLGEGLYYLANVTAPARQYIHKNVPPLLEKVSQTYAFLPREAVSYFLMSCNHCKLRIQTSNSILVKHGVPPVHVDSDQEDLTDGEGSVSSNDKEFESDMLEEPVRKRVKKEKIDNDYIHENGMDILDKFDTSPEDSEQENGNGDPEYVPNGKSMMKGEPGVMQQSNLDSALDMGISAPPKKLNSSGAAMMGKALTRTTRRGGGGGRRLSYSPETDKQLLEWVVERSRNGLPVSREAIQTQALALVRDECPDFKASSGWVEKFLIRHKISLPTRASMLENGGTRRGPPPLISNGTDSASTSPTPSPLSGNLSEGDKVEDGAAQPDVATRLIPADMLGMNRRGGGGGRKRGIKEMKDEEDDEEDEGEDGEGDCEKIVPEDVNPERLKAFNVFVRLFVDENLDRLVPISKQPKEKVLAIIHACHRQFPEFHDRARKRIRTYLKSCRRMKKPNEPLRRTADQINAVPSMSSAQMQEVNNILASACANEASLGERAEIPTVPTPPVQPPATKPSLMNGRAISPVETSRQSTSTMTSSSTPPPPRPLVPPMTRLPLAPESLAAARAKAGAEYKLNTTEVTAIRQLIASYRESAAFLYRSADELEALLPTSMLQPQKAVR